MLKLNASYSKKVPAEGEYSSQSYHASIEVELPDGLTQNQLNSKIHETFALVRDSVESELHGGDEAVCDWKTASSKWPASKADHDLQATAFCYAYKAIHGRSPLFRFDVYTKARQPTLNQYYTVRTQNELDRFAYLAGKIERSVEAGIFYPNESCMNCAECPYRERCKKWKGD